MMRWLFALLLLIPTVAPAASRTYSVGSFERVRIEGPFEVHIATGKSPGAHVDGDQAIVDQLEISVNGTTITVRLGQAGWGETPAKAATRAPVVTLTTPRLVGVAVVAGAEVDVGAMKAQRVDLTITGAGSLKVSAVDTDQLVATVVGTGALSAAGRASRATLQVNGPGTIDAPALASNDLIARVEGSGGIRTTARFTARVTTTGLGKVEVLGNAKCVVKAVAGGPVVCGGKP